MSLLEQYGYSPPTKPELFTEEVEPGIYLEPDEKPEEEMIEEPSKEQTLLERFQSEGQLRQDYQDTTKTEAFFTPTKTLENRFQSYKGAQDQAKTNLGISGRTQMMKRRAELEKETNRILGREESEFFKSDPDKDDRTKYTARGIGSGLSYGVSKYLEDEDVPEKFENNYLLGEAIGSTLPIMGINKLIGAPIKSVMEAKKFGDIAIGVTEGASTFGLFKAGKDAIQGEFNPLGIGLDAVIGGTIGGLIPGVPVLFQKGKDAYKWLQSLRTSQRSDMLTKGLTGTKLTDGQYAFFEKTVLPELQEVAKTDFDAAYEASKKITQAEYDQALTKIRAEHQEQISQLAQQGKDAQSPVAQKELEEAVKDVKAGFDRDMASIEEMYKRGIKEFEEAQESINQMAQREQAVSNAVDNEIDQGITTGFKDTQRSQNPTEQALNEISPEKVINTAEAGETLTDAIRANDAADYGIVNLAYDESRTLNEGISNIHPGLADELRTTVNHINSIPDPSPPLNQLRRTAHNTLNRLVELDEDGLITGYLEMTNQELLDQAQSLRYSRDYTFAHANVKGEFAPTLTAFNNAVETSAIQAGNAEAYEANQTARQLYRGWTEKYQNDYIRPFRVRANRDYSKNFNKVTSEIDQFPVVNDILETSHSGRQLADTLKRDIVQKRLGKLLDNPEASLSEFNKEINQIKHLLEPEEIQALQNSYENSHRDLALREGSKERVKGLKGVKKPSKPYLKSVKIPVKPKKVPVTQSMKDASRRIDMTVEDVQAMTKTPTGMRELKNRLENLPKPRGPHGKRIFKSIARRKIRNMLNEGKVKPDYTGNELYRAINKENNYDMLSEILGKETTDDLLKASNSIARQKVTRDRIVKIGIHGAKLHSLMLFGII